MGMTSMALVLLNTIPTLALLMVKRIAQLLKPSRLIPSTRVPVNSWSLMSKALEISTQTLRFIIPAFPHSQISSSQIHTQDDRFGNSDLGIRGMALFFVSFRRNPVCDFLKLPRFPLSSKERERMLASTAKQVKKPIGSCPPPFGSLP
jgi:hypothetical protein